MRWIGGGIVVWVICAGCAALLPEVKKTGSPSEPHARQAVLPLPYCTQDMESPEFWLKRLPDPDKLLLPLPGIERWNRFFQHQQLLTDIFSTRLWDFADSVVDRPEDVNPNSTREPRAGGRVEAYTLYTYCKDETERIKAAMRWDGRGNTLGPETWAALDKNLNTAGIGESNPIRFGLTRRRTDARYYPSDAVVTREPFDLEFDLLQVTAIQAFEPLALLHTSRDQAWLFVISANGRGWVRRNDVVEDSDPAFLQEFLRTRQPLVVTGHRVDAVWSPGSTETAETLYLGTVCPRYARENGYFRISLPVGTERGQLLLRDAYLPVSASVSAGFLPFTPRSVLTTAFSLMHQPYSWGGKGEYRDCSQFVMDVYATLGFRLPRNSSFQGKAGKKVWRVDRMKEPAEQARRLESLAAPALLQFPGHIMIYVGSVEGRPYAVHDIWSYRAVPEKTGEEDVKVIVGKIVISDLSLGEGTKRKSFLERLEHINPLHP